MIVYKKVTRDFKEYVLTLNVPSSACVISKADHLQASTVEVVSAEELDGKPSPHKVFYSLYDWNFKYMVGDKIESDICRTKGIYCFKSKVKAVKFMERIGDPSERTV